MVQFIKKNFLNFKHWACSYTYKFMSREVKIIWTTEKKIFQTKGFILNVHKDEFILYNIHM